jgi:hypothetical protein
MALIQNEVGPTKESKLYVWSATKGAPSNKKAVITAHGGGAWISGMGSAPSCTLVFYSPHGHILNDPSLSAIISGSVLPCGEPVNSKASQDYSLAKYTDTTGKIKHNKAGETYATVGGLDDAFKQQTASANSRIAMNNEAISAGVKVPGIDLHQVVKSATAEEARYAAGVSMDVITIRNRGWLSSPKLSEVITLLWKYGYKYDEIHCNFCRGGKAGFSPVKVD